MKKPPQKRKLATRAKLLDAATKVIARNGFGAMRVEQVVQDAGVAKGTFFAHFQDKDALLDIIVGAKIDAQLDAAELLPSPDSLDALVGHLMPLIQFMTCERYIFELIFRHSGAATKQEIGPIAKTFERQIELLTKWLAGDPYRKDVPPVILAEGIQAFMVQSMALNFCAINSAHPMESRLLTYLDAWLCPQTP